MQEIALRPKVLTAICLRTPPKKENPYFTPIRKNLLNFGRAIGVLQPFVAPPPPPPQPKCAWAAHLPKGSPPGVEAVAVGAAPGQEIASYGAQGSLRLGVTLNQSSKTLNPQP